AVLASTTLAFWAIIAGRSSSTWPVLTPWTAIPCLASSKISEDWSSALDGMQPMLRQVPPSVSRFSIQAVFSPSWAARMAATYPTGQLPITTTTNALYAIVGPPWHVGQTSLAATVTT